ncbi:MAG: TolC family protein, partial [Myxococcota bacterium]|nr:TolC family protein [Myxococcota bacterium]
MALIALLVGEAKAVEPPTTGPVTVEQAVERAVARPTLAAMLAAEAAVEDAEGAVRSRWPNPALSYEREQIVGGAHDGAEDAIVVSQSFELSGRRGLRADAATRRGDAARLEGEATLRRTAVAARRRFWDVVYQQARHEVAADWLRRLEAAQAIVMARLEAGEGSAYDGLRMAREVRMALTELGLSAVDREGAWLELLALTGPLAAPTQWPRVLGTLVPEEDPQRTAATSTRPDLRAWSKRA